jgi:formylmethanofuran dehydrogenase subunit B
MICPFCSLLCESRTLQDSCSLRLSSLQALNRRVVLPCSEKTPLEKTPLERARQCVERASEVHISGTVRSVESARAALKLARQTNASLDLSGNGASLEAVVATSRSGTYGASLGEARLSSDWILVIDSDGLLEQFPKLPETMLRSSSPPSLLLLGNTSPASAQRWESCFADVLTIPCRSSQVPHALRSWHKHVGCQEPDEGTGYCEQLARATYISVVWSASTSESLLREFWIQRLLETILEWNESRRAVSVCLSGLESVSVQPCLWTTGFPGRIQFLDHEPRFQPELAATARWVEDHGRDTQAVWIELSEGPSSSNSAEPAEFLGQRICLGTTPPVRSEDIWFPSLVAGWERPADMLRADQLVLLHVPAQSTLSSTKSEPARESIASWIERLVP